MFMHMNTLTHMRGLTFVELMITLAVAAILLFVAVPNFQVTIQNNRITTQANSLVTAANMARAEAVRRSQDVVLCSSTDGQSCNGGTDWARGWIIRVAGNGEVLREWGRLAGQPSMSSSNGHSQVAFQRDGTAGFSAGDFELVLRSTRCMGDQVRRIEILRSGRTRVERESC
jgi:type IV fimbrial biogenesis protein FimT